MPAIQELYDANARYAQTFAEGGKPMPPARRVAVLTCMDARIDPLPALGLGLGDAHVVRNAGGRASDDALRSLVISERLLGTTEIVVIHHTDCGMTTFENRDIVAKIRTDLGDAAAEEAARHDFLPFADLEASVRDDVATIRNHPLIPESILVSGAIYDVNTALLTRVD